MSRTVLIGGPHVPHLRASLAWLAGYVGRRFPDYFRREPVRILAPDGARLDAGPVELAPLLADVGAEFGVRLVLEPDPDQLNAVDRLLQERLGGFPGLLSAPPASDAPGPSDLTRATPLVIVNALGQGEGYWTTLVDRLRQHRRVVLLQARGADGQGGLTTLDDHVTDLDAVVRELAAPRCDLLGWCTGAKTVLSHYLRRPDTVSSIVLLNPTFKHPDRPAELDTTYEQQLEALSAFLAERPGSVGRVMRMFGGDLFGAGMPDDGLAGPQLAAAVLALPDPELDAERRRPFASAADMIQYTGQLRDFWSRDLLASAGDVRVPTLVIAGEHDQIVSGAALRAAADRFPYGRFAQLTGSTHYGMYEQPDVLGDLIESFTTNAAG